MSYRLTGEGYVIRIADGAKVPITTSSEYPNTNSDYLAYLAWLEAGNTPTPAPKPDPVVPQAVTMRQARLALLGAGLLSSVEGAIDALAEPTKTAARIEWEYSQEVHRNKQLVLVLAPLLGLTEQQLDNLFIAAAEL